MMRRHNLRPGLAAFRSAGCGGGSFRWSALDRCGSQEHPLRLVFQHQPEPLPGTGALYVRHVTLETSDRCTVLFGDDMDDPRVTSVILSTPDTVGTRLTPRKARHY